MKQLKSLAFICLSTLFLFLSGCKEESTNVQHNKNKFKLATKTAKAVSVGQTVSLKGSNGMYVSSENGTEPMNCDRTTAQDWEKFTIVDAGGGKIALRSMGKYVSSENGTQPINCNRTSVQDWEKFTLVNNSDGTVSFRGNNGRYISSENGTSSMTCNRTAIGGWEKFSTGTTTTPPPTGTWRRANLTNFTSYPDPNSDECINYNGCLWAGQFAFVSGKQSESWVQANNIIAVHSKDADQYKLKTLRIRQGTLQIDAKVYDMCADSDCNGCCTENCAETGFLIDIEKYTMQRFGSGSGIVEWMCLDCQ
ncbi:MAG TPA: hypothetical protein VD908_07110 [Cytophagales bacterium]|nr:hypothetical protein [Cytophagales bacterium]